MPGLFFGLYLVMLADRKRPKRCARKLGKLGVQFSHSFRKSAKWMGHERSSWCEHAKCGLLDSLCFALVARNDTAWLVDQRSATRSRRSKNSGKLMDAESAPRIKVSPSARRAATLKAMAMR
jgi:hypothetical protein